MYHSFPRRKAGEDELRQGLAILKGMVKHGLLLTPEIVVWQEERKADGTLGPVPTSYCTRVCFTELATSEVAAHADHFGVFALEFEVSTLRQLGAMPIFYVPRHDDHQGMSGVGAAYIARIGDLQSLLERLREFQLFARTNSESTEPSKTQIGVAWSVKSNCLVLSAGSPERTLQVPAEVVPQKVLNELRKSPGVAQPLGLNTHALDSILSILTWGIQDYEIQLNALRGLTGFFYPTERNEGDIPLNYYRQREWRILGGQTKNGIAFTPDTTSSEASELVKLDADFFGREIELRTGPKRLADTCEYFRELDGAHVFSFVRRVVCPETAKATVQAILDKAGYGATLVAALESL
jgi:hypothetical protein